jgi:hypothetical protein
VRIHCRHDGSQLGAVARPHPRLHACGYRARTQLWAPSRLEIADRRPGRRWAAGARSRLLVQRISQQARVPIQSSGLPAKHAACTPVLRAAGWPGLACIACARCRRHTAPHHGAWPPRRAWLQGWRQACAALAAQTCCPRCLFATQGGQSDSAHAAAVLPRAPPAVLSGSSVLPWLQQRCWVCELPACVPAGVLCAWVRTRNCCRTRVIAAPPHGPFHLTACLGRAGGSIGRRAQSGGPHVPGRRATSGAVGTVILGAWVGRLLHANHRAAGTAPKRAPASPRRDGFPVAATVTTIDAEVRAAAAASFPRRPCRRPGAAAVLASRSADGTCAPSAASRAERRW